MSGKIFVTAAIASIVMLSALVVYDFVTRRPCTSAHEEVEYVAPYVELVLTSTKPMTYTPVPRPGYHRTKTVCDARG